MEIEFTDKDLKKQKNKLKGNCRHDPEETRKLQVMRLGLKYDVVIDDDTQISTKVYNDICGYQRKTKRFECGRGKYKRNYDA